jgi:CTP-dependent riboflavin kinase
MSRKIAALTKNTYVKHINSDNDPAPGEVEEGINMVYEDDLIQKAEAILDAADAGTGEGQVSVGMPKFFIDMEKYRTQIQLPYIFENERSAVPVEKDEEVFRQEIPDF